MRSLIFILSILCTGSCVSNKWVQLDEGLTYKILKKGKGIMAREGDEILIHETMSYQHDSLLFSSYDMPHPIKCLIGGKQVIDGIDKGVRGMKEGEIRKLIIPPSLSKRMGNQTFPHPDSTLIYKIELVEIISK